MGEGVGLAGRVWYPKKARHDGHNMTIENETLFLSVYKPTAMQILLGGTVPQFGDGVELGFDVVPLESPPY